MKAHFDDRRVSRRTLLQASSGAAVAGILAYQPLSAAAQATPAAVSSEGVTSEAVEAAIAKLEPMIVDMLAASGVPGLSVAIVHDDAVVYAKGFGVRSVNAPDLVDAETVFQLASVSKTLASTTVSALVSDGDITWDDAVVSHLPDFQLSDPWMTREVTLRDCFSHRTGMFGTAGDDLEDLGFSRDEIIHQMRYLNLTGEFRRTYSYSNHGLTLGAEAAAKAVGSTWEDIAESRLYQPLGMTSTSSRFADFESHENRALLHVPIDGEWTQGFTRYPDPQSPAGGVSSNVVDLAEWMRMLLADGTYDGEDFISADVLNDSHTPQISKGPGIYGGPSFYGLGWSIETDDMGRLALTHAGAFSVGARTQVHLIPADNLGIVVLANAFPTGVPEGISYSFFDLVHYGALTRDWAELWNGNYQQLYDSFAVSITPYVTPPVSPDPALAADTYAGTYANEYFGDLVVMADGENLTITVGPAPKIYPLTHWERDVFIFDATPEIPGAKGTATFLIDTNGQAIQVTLDTLNSYGQGTFERTVMS